MCSHYFKAAGSRIYNTNIFYYQETNTPAESQRKGEHEINVQQAVVYTTVNYCYDCSCFHSYCCRTNGT